MAPAGPRASYARRPGGLTPAGGATDGLDFAVDGMGASDNEAFAFLRFAVRMKSPGREASFHLHHYFRFGPDGKIEYYRGSEDSAQVAQALAS